MFLCGSKLSKTAIFYLFPSQHTNPTSNVEIKPWDIGKGGNIYSPDFIPTIFRRDCTISCTYIVILYITILWWLNNKTCLNKIWCSYQKAIASYWSRQYFILNCLLIFHPIKREYLVRRLLFVMWILWCMMDTITWNWRLKKSLNT